MNIKQNGGEKGVAIGQFSEVSSITSQNNIYIADFGNWIYFFKLNVSIVPSTDC
jgi:hypothetical protein